MRATRIKAMLLAGTLVLPTPGFAQTKSDKAGVYLGRGLAKMMKNDLDGARADFTTAIKLDPKDAIAYAARGDVNLGKGGNVDSANADYNRALELDPNLSNAYAGRGDVKHRKWDLDGALADYNRAIKLDRELITAYVGRSSARLFTGDLNGAIADYNQVLKLDRNDRGPSIAKEAYVGRAYANFLARKWPNALQDYKRFCELSKRDQEYPRLFTWLIQSRLGEKEAANKELASYFKTAPGNWASKIAAYLLGNVSEAELLTAAKSADAKTARGQRCEAFFYVGMKKLLVGDKDAAADYFKKCLTTQQESYYEYLFAKAELKALGQ